MEVLTPEKFRKLIDDYPIVECLFTALKPYLKECSRCEGVGEIKDAALTRFPCPECKPERREGQRRNGIGRRDKNCERRKGDIVQTKVRRQRGDRRA